MKQEKIGSSIIALVRSWVLAALGGLGICLGAARLAAGVLAKGESYEAALPVVALALAFLGGLGAGALGLWLTKGAWSGAFAPGLLLVLGFLSSGFVFGGGLCSFSHLLLRAGALMLGGALVYWLTKLGRGRKARGKNFHRNRRQKRKKSEFIC